MNTTKKLFQNRRIILPVRKVLELKMRDYEVFRGSKYEDKGSYIYICDMRGSREPRGKRLREIAKQFGATNVCEIGYSSPDIESSYYLWAENNKMTSSMQIENKSLTFTFRALEKAIGNWGWNKWDSKEVDLPKKYVEEGFRGRGCGGYYFTQKGKSQTRNIEELLLKAVDIAKRINADVINVDSIGGNLFDEPISTKLTLKFYRI